MAKVPNGSVALVHASHETLRKSYCIVAKTNNKVQGSTLPMGKTCEPLSRWCLWKSFGLVEILIHLQVILRSSIQCVLRLYECAVNEFNEFELNVKLDDNWHHIRMPIVSAEIINRGVLSSERQRFMKYVNVLRVNS